MAIELKGLPQISQDGKYLWWTDTTGEYDVTDNETGWGAPNFELSQSALLLYAYRMSNPKVLVTPVSPTITRNASAANDYITTFQLDYLQDGYHQFHFNRLMASNDDSQSIDQTPVVFTIGDIWLNTNDNLVKELTSGGIIVLDLTLDTDLDKITANASTTVLLCEQMYYKNLSVERNNRYTSGRQARRDEDTAQIVQMRIDQTDIILGTASAAYQFAFGLKNEAHDTIESLLDDFNLN